MFGYHEIVIFIFILFILQFPFIKCSFEFDDCYFHFKDFPFVYDSKIDSLKFQKIMKVVKKNQNSIDKNYLRKITFRG